MNFLKYGGTRVTFIVGKKADYLNNSTVEKTENISNIFVSIFMSFLFLMLFLNF